MNYFLNYVGGVVSIDTYRKPTAQVTSVDDIVDSYHTHVTEDLVADLTDWIENDTNEYYSIKDLLNSLHLNPYDYPELMGE